jgi:dienelactone hydrolase
VPTVVTYDLGTVTITQAGAKQFREMPVILQGVLAVPEGEGPFPVALVMHGSYLFCTAEPVGAGESADPSVSVPMGDDPAPYPCPAENDLRQYEGFGELAAALAADGYLTLVPDMSPEYAEGFGSAPFGDRAIQIADAHLDALAAGTGLPDGVAGKADLDRLVLVGHSRGGSLVVRYATDEEATYTPRALALLTPAYLVGKTVIPKDMPVALVIAQCDGDVGTKEPLKFTSKEQLPPLRTAPTLVYTLPNGTHNGFSTKLQPEQEPRCKDRVIMAPEEQRAIAGDLVPAFFDLALAVEGRS